ncbi:acyl-coenzyme A diphosphatase NUDT19 isoform X2 [Nomia melanderi]|uniref:acyl-coenzyme A diphosphatase NUDT19 isoform X2 n=1 Tax=Nomia melanderi TaxID=2448451 RepID=UPI0013042339|nr:nucleoside diphosphate-linked moiety X motif 19-like isoform X2 [Nomia melanderi]
MKAFKESASLILAARRAQQYIRQSSPTNYNYDLLSLKRHRNSNFMPSAYVFPGGVIHPSDTDLKWQNLFSSFGFDNNSFASLIPNAATRPQIFKRRSNELPREISLRINAIRETFEECGILLCNRIQNGSKRSDWAQHLEMPENELHEWQEKVHLDATKFYSMCEKFECYPDLWALYEWSNWLTPSFFLNRRYDTVFYMACMQSVPPTVCESTEIEDVKWDTPSNHLSSTSVNTVPPPQAYEITRIAKFESIDDLLDFAVDRTKKGVRLTFPIRVKLQNGNVHVLPGDSMYPKLVSLYEKQVIDRTDITIDDFKNISPILNRIEFITVEVTNFIVQNFDTEDDSLSPKNLDVHIK